MAFSGTITIHARAARASMIVPARSKTTVMMPSSGSTARFMSTKYSHEDYSSMTISELREMLRLRGQAVSGIKAQLIERLATGEIKVGNKPKKVEKKPQKKNMKSQATHSGDDPIDDSGDYDEVEDDLAALVDHLKDPNAGDSTTSREQMGKGIKSANRLPRNLVFAKEGDDDDYDDDKWDDDDDDDDDEFDPNKTVAVPRKKRPDKRTNAITFKEDFQGTRVFVQGLPEEATWKDLKDHFKIAGDVVFASVSIDSRTGKSKQCGIVQFETPAMAQEAIREMRNNPMNGAKLFVRKDVQESHNRERGSRSSVERRSNDDRLEYKKTTAPPTGWTRANDKEEDGSGDSWYNLKDEELKEIESIIERRDKQRRQRNWKMSDQMRNQLKEDFGVHLDDNLQMWWTDTKHGGVPGLVSEIKGEGRWGKVKPWRQIPTDPENDAMVDSDRVMQLLLKRDRARRRKDFDTADDLLEKAHSSPQGGLGLRIHDESRTWRIWTERPPSRSGETPSGYEKLTPGEMCLQIVTEHEPEKVDEVKEMLRKFPGREWNIFKRLRGRYNNDVSE